MPGSRASTLKGVSLQVDGLDQLRKELKKLDDAGLINKLKDANYQVASLVVAHAKTKAAALGPMQARAAETLTASRAAASAAVTGGGAKAPFFGGAEFGAGRNVLRNTTRGVVRGWNQFQSWRGNSSSAGYFLYPTIRDDEEEIIETYGKAVDKIFTPAFPD